jgi:adenylate cyclase
MASPNERLAVLRGVSMFRGLSAQTMFELARRATEPHHPAGDTLVRQGAWGDSLSIITRGRASVRSEDRVVAEVGVGDYFGGPFSVPGAPRMSDVIAVDDVTILEVAASDLEELMRIPEVARAVIERLGDQSAAEAPLPVDGALQPPDGPSIAVLPFDNMSGDPEQEYFSDGLTEDLITDLSKLSGVLVIARNSVFTYKGRAVKVQDVGRELGVRSVLEGSVRRAGNRVRITAQLIDAETGGHLWSERYDRDIDDIFAVQDEVTGSIVAALSVELSGDEQGLLSRRETEDLVAYDHVLRGIEAMKRFTKAAYREARGDFERAIELDPAYALAYAHLGVLHHLTWVLAYTDDPEAVEHAAECAARALALDDSLAEGHMLAGLIHMDRNQHEEAIAELERAAELSPNDAGTWYTLASVSNMAGYPERAIGLVERAMRLNPHYSVEYPWELGHSYYLIGDLQKAIVAMTRALALNPEFHPAHFFLVAAYSELGLDEAAHEHLEALLETWEQASIDDARKRLHYADPAVTERLFTALRKAGLEG